MVEHADDRPKPEISENNLFTMSRLIYHWPMLKNGFKESDKIGKTRRIIIGENCVQLLSV
jgi:hypothetical protein